MPPQNNPSPIKAHGGETIGLNVSRTLKQKFASRLVFGKLLAATCGSDGGQTNPVAVCAVVIHRRNRNHWILRNSMVTADAPSEAKPNTAAGMSLRKRIIFVYGFLIAANILAWVWALISFHQFPLLLGTAFLAYTFGLRHAVDADHIAAIDNVTRKMMQQGKRPVGIGLFFSLGHSTIVVGLSIAIAAASVAIKDRFNSLASIGGVIGTAISAFFLIAIAAANIFVLLSVYNTFQRVKSGGRYVEEDLNLILSSRGFFGGLFRRLFRMIDHSWQMYFVGFLFGLGFDTATEVGLLGISATEATKGLPIWSILVFPALFTAGMTLIDSTDSILMLGAYGWAFVKPLRKLYYNMTITFVSILVALLVGGIEVLGLIRDEFKIRGFVWDLIGTLNDHFGMVGFGIIAIFALSWVVSYMIYRGNRYDEIKVSIDPSA